MEESTMVTGSHPPGPSSLSEVCVPRRNTIQIRTRIVALDIAYLNPSSWACAGVCLRKRPGTKRPFSDTCWYLSLRVGTWIVGPDHMAQLFLKLSRLVLESD